MTDPERPAIDPDDPVPLGDLKRFTRPKRSLKRYLVPFLLAIVITVAAFALLAFIGSWVVSLFG